MKTILFTLSLALVLTSCSSGTTVADLPSNTTNAFRGTFSNTRGTQSGSVTLDIVDSNGAVTGNIIFSSSGSNCLSNGAVTGNSTGFNLSLIAPQEGSIFTVTFTEVLPTDPTDTLGTRISFMETGVSTSGSISEVRVVLENGNIQITETTEQTRDGEQVFVTTVSIFEPGESSEPRPSEITVSTRELITTVRPTGSDTRELSNGNFEVRTFEEEAFTGELNMQFTIGDSGNSLRGTYTSDSETACSNGTGAGTMELRRG